ncbi:MAG: DivIVA domain-containing protein [Actinomycetota bacterium]
MQPELTPEDIETASFTIAIRGYDKQEVEAFLADTADLVRALTDASGNAYVDLGEEMGELLQHARNSADQMTAQAQEEVTALRAQIDAEIADKRREADEYVRRSNEDISSEVKRLRQGAEEQARAIIEDAQQRIVTLQREEVEARERIRALRLQLLEVTLRLQRFEVADESEETSDDEDVEAFEPTTDEPETMTAPTGAAFTAPAELVDNEPGQEDGSDLEAEEEATATSFATEPVEVINLEEDRAEESSR